MKHAVVLVLLATSSAASADRWMTAELPTAVAVSSMQNQAFRAGAMPAVGGYVSSGRFAIGARLRAGILRDGAAPGGNMADPGIGGLATAGLAARVELGGGWLELVGGGGVTGHDLVPAVEAGAGWSFAVGGATIGPSVRYVRVVASSADAFGSADLVLIGADLQLGRARERVVAPPPVLIAEPVVAAAAPLPPLPPPVITRDDDRVADRGASCADLLEFLDSDSGCGAGGAVEVTGNRIILDDRVLFDTDRAHVHAAGREVIRAIAKAAAQHPEWQTITIEGHADVRGDDHYNQVLSERRAQRARTVLIRAGFPAERVEAVGYGRSRPRDAGTSPKALQRNRRVEFVIDRTAEVAP